MRYDAGSDDTRENAELRLAALIARAVGTPLSHDATHAEDELSETDRRLARALARAGQYDEASPAEWSERLSRILEKNSAERTSRSSHTIRAVRYEKHTWSRWLSATAIVGGIAVALSQGVFTHTPGNAAHELDGARYTTTAGEQKNITLPDGSHVLLAPQTTLRLASGFGTTTREMSLTGEAYFDVPRTTGIPFVVRTAQSTTRVLGTTFAVRRYAADRATHIAVVTGKVSVAGTTRVGDPAPASTLVAGMAMMLADSSDVITRDPTDITAWQSGWLVFRGTPAEEVFATLSRWYGYQFKNVDSTLAHQVVTLGVQTGSSEDALATLRQILDVELTVDGKVVTVHTKRGTGSSSREASPRHQNMYPSHTEVGR